MSDLLDHDHDPVHDSVRAERVAISTLWANVRIVVIDTETCTPPAGGRRVLSIAAVTCRNGTVRGKWQTLVNAGVLIDPGSQRIHGITEDHLIGEPSFAEVVDSLVALLTPAGGRASRLRRPQRRVRRQRPAPRVRPRGHGPARDSRARHVADAYAGLLAAAGRSADLQAGIDVCDAALATRHDSTHEGWTRLASRRDQLAGRLQRLTFRPSGRYGEDGNPIPVRNHHPTTPRRTRPPRFVGA